MVETSRARSARSSLLRSSVSEEDVSERVKNDLSFIGVSSRRADGGDLNGLLEQASERFGWSSVGPAHRYDTTLYDLFDHS